MSHAPHKCCGHHFPPGGGVQRCALAGEREHCTARTATAAPLGCAPPILGIDPGVHGGVAFLYSGHVTADDIPVVGGEVDVDALVRRVREMRPRLAIIERAGAMPQQGVSSTFKYGVAYGALRTVVALCNIPYQSTFELACEQADREQLPRPSRPRATMSAPPSTVEALTFALRKGAISLTRPETVRRLSMLDRDQLKTVCRRVQAFQPGIAQPWSTHEVDELIAAWRKQ